MLPALRESVARRELTVARDADQGVIAFVNWHTRRDKITTVYEIAVRRDFCGRGIGKRLIDSLPRPVRLKCTQDNVRANAFYEAMGFTLQGVDPGRKRPLNVWVLHAPVSGEPVLR